MTIYPMFPITVIFISGNMPLAPISPSIGMVLFLIIMSVVPILYALRAERESMKVKSAFPNTVGE